MAIYGPDGKGVAGGTNEESTTPGEERVEERVRRIQRGWACAHENHDVNWLLERLRAVEQELTECRARERDTWERVTQLEQVEVPGLRVRLREVEGERDSYKHVVTIRNRSLDQAEERLAQAEQRVAHLEALLREFFDGTDPRWITRARAALTPPQPAPREPVVGSMLNTPITEHDRKGISEDGP